MKPMKPNVPVKPPSVIRSVKPIFLSYLEKQKVPIG